MAVKSAILKELLGRAKTGGLTKTQLGVLVGAGALSQEEAEASFIGRAAKTFSKEALDLAEKMTAKGATRDEIWKETGERFGMPTFKDVDGNWKQEISDEAFSLDPAIPEMSEHGFKTASGDVFQNEALREAYPDLFESMKVSFEPSLKPQGSYSQISASELLGRPQEHFIRLKDPAKPAPLRSEKMSNWIKKLREWTKPDYVEQYAKDYDLSMDEAAKEVREDISIITENIEKARAQNPNEIEFYKNTASTAAHELQHGVQEIEGFAQGGSPAQFEPDFSSINADYTFTQKLLENSPAATQLKTDFEKLTGEKPDILLPTERMVDAVYPEYADWYKNHPAYKDLRKELNKAQGIRESKIKREKERVGRKGFTGRDAYKRLAGEAEARNVQTRLPYSIKERIETPPWQTLDVPEDELIVELNKRNLSPSEKARLYTSKAFKPVSVTGGLAGLSSTAQAGSDFIPETGGIRPRRLPMPSVTTPIFEGIEATGDIELPIIGAPFEGIADWARHVGYNDSAEERLKRAFFGALDIAP